MSPAIRCFIAVKILAPNPLRRTLRALSEMGRAIKAVDIDNLHLTLKFLGDTDPDLVPEIGSLLAQKAAAHRGQPCVITLTGLGVFPNAQRPNVLWAGIHGAEMLVALAEELETALEPLGFARERRPFVPHLTLARVKAKPPESFHDVLNRHAKTQFGTVAVTEVALMRSELEREGSRYTVLATSPLS
jgi:RNA 2',3'-cyclic 3'-phosphodiesterase